MAPRPTEADLATRPIMNRAPHSVPNNVPLSLPYTEAVAAHPDGAERGTQWSPYGIFQPRVYRGGHDPASVAGDGLMHTERGDYFDASPNPWPNNGQFDRPNGFFTGLLRLAPHTSAHPGRTMPTGAGPTMLFRAPPIFSIQQQPISAVGV